MNVLYVVGKNDLSDNKTLRYSLRSVDRFAKGVDDVFVVGYPPSWLKCKTLAVEDVTHGISGGKHWNILNCILRAIYHFGIKGEFLYSSDDHILLRDVDFDKWPRWKCGKLYTHDDYVAINKKEPGAYQKSLIATRALYDKFGVSPIKCSCHANTIMNADYADAAGKLANDNREMCSFGFEPTCLFTLCELIDGKRFDLKEYSDFKCKTIADVEQRAGSHHFAMTLEHGAETNKPIDKWLKKKFEEKSRWEK